MLAADVCPTCGRSGPAHAAAPVLDGRDSFCPALFALLCVLPRPALWLLCLGRTTRTRSPKGLTLLPLGLDSLSWVLVVLPYLLVCLPLGLPSSLAFWVGDVMLPLTLPLTLTWMLLPHQMLLPRPLPPRPLPLRPLAIRAARRALSLLMILRSSRCAYVESPPGPLA